MNLRTFALYAALFPAACQTPADPPSLRPRAIEQRPAALPAPFPARPSPISAEPALMAALDQLLTDAKSGDADFARLERSNAAILIAGQRSAPGSEAWLSAEMLRSALEVARQKSASALADVDALVVTRSEQASRDPSTAGLDEILSTQAKIAAIVERQSQRLAALSR